MTELAIVQDETIEIPTAEVEFVKELYPRIRPDDATIERYRDSLEKLPPIVLARGNILVDGYHRWQAHSREEIEIIHAIDLGNLSDAQIIRESITRNASHGQQLSKADKQKLAGWLWTQFSDMDKGERTIELAEMLAVTERTITNWTKEARKQEKEELQDIAWDMHLHCHTQQGISDVVNADQSTVGKWIMEKGKLAVFHKAPGATDDQLWGNVQHFDVWNFASNDKDGGGQQSYFGALPPQIMENLLWLYTEPGNSIVVDPFAGSGTALEVAHRMGRRAWVSDIRGDHYSPHLTIHQHDITQGWPEAAPNKADLIFLDPPYWKQAAGKYSQEPNELAEMSLEDFNAAWIGVLETCKPHLAENGKAAFIISPTEDGGVVDHAFEMAMAAFNAGFKIHRRIIVTYNTQQATGQQVTWARENRRLLKLYRDLVVIEAR